MGRCVGKKRNSKALCVVRLHAHLRIYTETVLVCACMLGERKIDRFVIIVIPCISSISMAIMDILQMMSVRRLK